MWKNEVVKCGGYGCCYDGIKCYFAKRTKPTVFPFHQLGHFMVYINLYNLRGADNK